MIQEEEPQIMRDDQTPSIIAQAKKAGWEASLYHFGKAESEAISYFNPGICRRPDGLWLMVRRSENIPGSPFGMNAVYAMKLDESGKVPSMGVKLVWNGAQEGQQIEDARAFYVPHMQQTGVGVCTFQWHGHNSWTGAIQALGFFDENWQCKVVHYPPFDTNATKLENVTRERFQKNWLWWMSDEQLLMLYKSDPWTVVEFGGGWEERQIHTSAGAKWSFGEIRGGTPPVLVDGRYYSFFHSSLGWRGRYRRYFMGAIAFSAEAPYEVLAVTKEPLLRGSQNDPWGQRKPLCVFPCGSDFKNGKWFVTLGVNDLRAAWVEIPHQDVLLRLNLDVPASVPVRAGNGSAFTPLTPEHPISAQLEAQRARMAHARAARAAKLAKKAARKKNIALKAARV